MRALAVMAVLAAGAAAAGGEPLEAWLPEGTYVRVTFPDLPRTRARADSGRWRGLLGEPAAQRLAFRGALLHDEARLRMALEGRPWPGPLWSVADRLTLAVVPVDGRPRPLVLLEAGGDFERCLAALRDAGALGRRTTVPCGGATLVLHAATPAEGPGGALWHLREGARVAIAWDRRTLEDVAGRRGGASRPGDAGADATVHLAWEALASLDGAGPALALLGAGPGSTLDASVTLTDEGLAVRLLLRLPDGRRGLLALLGEGGLAPPPFLPAGTHSFVALRFDPRGDLRGALAEVDPEAAARVPADPEAFLRYAGGEAAVRFFRALGDEFAAAQILPGAPRVEIAEVTGPAAARRLLAGLRRREGDVFVHPDGGGFAVLGDRLVACRRKDYVRLLAEAPEGPGLADAPAWRTVTAPLPRTGFLLWYLRTAPAARREHWTALVEAQAAVASLDPEGLRVDWFASLAPRE